MSSPYNICLRSTKLAQVAAVNSFLYVTSGVFPDSKQSWLHAQPLSQFSAPPSNVAYSQHRSVRLEISVINLVSFQSKTFHFRYFV